MMSSEPMEIAKREQDKQDQPDVTFTGKSIKETLSLSLNTFRDALIETAYDVAYNGAGTETLRKTFDDYHRALRTVNVGKEPYIPTPSLSNWKKVL